MAGLRKDRIGEHRTALDKNKKIIFKTQDVCGICGLPVDKGLKYPDPMSKTVDHIIPIAKGGHPSDLANLQLAHRICNRQKADKILSPAMKKGPAPEKDPGTKKTRAGGETAGAEKARASKRPAGTKTARQVTAWDDNDNLPLHCDWLNVHWD